MGRSSRSQAEENRTRIVEIASSLFRENGIDAVGIADVMKAAGMTQGGFYKHFANKNALATEACQLAFTKAERNWRNLAERAKRDGKSVSDELVAYYLAPKAPEMTCPILAFADDVARLESSDPLQIAYHDGVQALYQAFTELVSEKDEETSANHSQVLFTGMIGANLLTRASRNRKWADLY